MNTLLEIAQTSCNLILENAIQYLEKCTQGSRTAYGFEQMIKSGVERLQLTERNLQRCTSLMNTSKRLLFLGLKIKHMNAIKVRDVIECLLVLNQIVVTRMRKRSLIESCNPSGKRTGISSNLNLNARPLMLWIRNKTKKKTGSLFIRASKKTH